MRRYDVQFTALCALALLALSSSSKATPTSNLGTVRKHARTVKGTRPSGQYAVDSRWSRLGKRDHTHTERASNVQCNAKSRQSLLGVGMNMLQGLYGSEDLDDDEDVEEYGSKAHHGHPHKHGDSSCFPALGFNMPNSPPDSVKGWWCNPDDEYAFMGFSYEITACQSQEQLTREFKDARKTFNSRYIRLYGACDEQNYYDKVVDAAWEAGLGVQALIWFGFDGDDKWKKRRDDLVQTLQSNRKAKFVTRGIQFGSEPLFDDVLPPKQLADEVRMLQQKVHPMGINVSVSDLTYAFQSKMDNGAQDLIDQLDFIDVHMLPYFAQNASTGDKGFLNDVGDQAYMEQYACGKKIYWSENGWPSSHDCPGVCPNSKDAVSDVANEKAYFDKLDEKCDYFREHGVGWFAHIYNDQQENGYGIYGTDEKTKFHFAPKTKCETGGRRKSKASSGHQDKRGDEAIPSQRRTLRRF